MRRDPHALVEEAASRLSVLESRFGFHPEAAEDAVLAYRNSDDLVVKVTRSGSRLLGEMIFIEFLPADDIRVLYSSGTIKRGSRDDYGRELEPMVAELLAALSKLRLSKEARD